MPWEQRQTHDGTMRRRLLPVQRHWQTVTVTFSLVTLWVCLFETVPQSNSKNNTGAANRVDAWMPPPSSQPQWTPYLPAWPTPRPKKRRNSRTAGMRWNREATNDVTSNTETSLGNSWGVPLVNVQILTDTNEADPNDDHQQWDTWNAALMRHGLGLIRAAPKATIPLLATDPTDQQSLPHTPKAAPVASYRWNAAVGMLQLDPQNNIENDRTATSYVLPRWIPIHQDKETVLVSNGWSFLDADDSEPSSAYSHSSIGGNDTHTMVYNTPHWNRDSPQDSSLSSSASTLPLELSPLGFSLHRLSADQVLSLASVALTSELSRTVLLQGVTDPPHRKLTNNGHDFSSSSSSNILALGVRGVFCCPIGGLPLFGSDDLSLATTVASGWLSFVRPVCPTHVRLYQPPPQASSGSFGAENAKQATDRRVEVVCAKSACHLGHFFGDGEGYCINASALNFIPMGRDHDDIGCSIDNNRRSGMATTMDHPVSHRSLELVESTPSVQTLRQVIRSQQKTEWVALGAGCFWHVESALRRLPGIVSTRVGYAGGATTFPTYEQVCRPPTAKIDTTGHAEVVLVEWDATVLLPCQLLDCFFAMHDPTKVRSHGTHAPQTGQYRSCILLPPESSALAPVVREALAECQRKLGNEISTEVVPIVDSSNPWFWEAEERHQLHDQSKGSAWDGTTLSMADWLDVFGTRRYSIDSLYEAIEETRLMI